jgi:hypothetical protein
LQAVEEAVSFWKRTLEEIGSITRTGQPVPEEALQSLSASMLGGAGGPSKITISHVPRVDTLLRCINFSGRESGAGPHTAWVIKRLTDRGAGSGLQPIDGLARS